MKREIKGAFVNTLPIMAGYLALGFGFGIIAQRGGYGVGWAIPMGIFIYAGSGQYVAVELLTSGVTLLNAAITTLMVNARHLFYGISMVDLYKGTGKIKPYLIFGLTDETYSLLCTGKCPEGANFHRYAFFVTLFDHIYWITGGALGALVGALVDFDSTGVDFVMTALFITIFAEQWKTTRNHAPALIGVAVALVCLLIFGSDAFLIPALLAISAALLLGRKFIDRTAGGDTPQLAQCSDTAEEKEGE